MGLRQKVQVDLGEVIEVSEEEIWYLSDLLLHDVHGDYLLRTSSGLRSQLVLEVASATELRALIGHLAWLLSQLPYGGLVEIRTAGKPVKLQAGADEDDLERIFRLLVTPTLAGASDDLTPVSATALSVSDLAGSDSSRDQEPDQGGTSEIPIMIYLSDETIHEQVEDAIEALLDLVGLRIISREEAVHGSWFRRMQAAVKGVTRSQAAREATLVAAHAADTRLVLAQDAAVTAALLQNLGPVLGALQPTKDAVIRAGALLIVKVDWVVNVFQLTAAQQLFLDHSPQIARSPHRIIAALDLMPDDHQADDPLALG